MKLLKATGMTIFMLFQATVSHAEKIDKVMNEVELGAGIVSAGSGLSLVNLASPEILNKVASKPLAKYGEAVNLSTEKWIDGIKGTKIVNEDILVLGAEKQPKKVSDWPLEPTTSKDGKLRVMMDAKTRDVIVTNYGSNGQAMNRVKLDYQPAGLTHSLFLSETELITLNGDGEVRKFDALTGKQIEFKNPAEQQKATKLLLKTDPRFSDTVNFKGRPKYELETYVAELNQKRAAAKLPPVEVYRVSRVTPLVKVMTETNQRLNYKQLGRTALGSAFFAAGVGLIEDYGKNSAYEELREVKDAPAIQPVSGRTAKTNSTR